MEEDISREDTRLSCKDRRDSKNYLKVGTAVGLVGVLAGGVMGFNLGEETVQNFQFLMDAPQIAKYSVEMGIGILYGLAGGGLSACAGGLVALTYQYVFEK